MKRSDLNLMGLKIRRVRFCKHDSDAITYLNFMVFAQKKVFKIKSQKHIFRTPTRRLFHDKRYYQFYSRTA